MRWYKRISAFARAFGLWAGLVTPAQLIADGYTVTGRVQVVVTGPDGREKSSRYYNTVTTAGKAGIADQILASPSLSKPGWMAVGTGSPAANALGTELDRNAFSSKTRSGAVVTMVASWAAGDGTGTLTEMGTFDASSTGNMWMSATIGDTKGASDTLTGNWTLTVS